MTGNGTIDDIARLTTRVDTLEREVEGEKTVTRYILEQTRRNGDDLAAVKTRLGRVENRLDGVENRLNGVENRLNGVENRLNGVENQLGGVEQKLDRQIDEFAEWRKSLPSEIAEVMREVLREHRS